MPDYLLYFGGKANDQSGVAVVQDSTSAIHGNPIAVYLDGNGQGHAFITGTTNYANIYPSPNDLISSRNLSSVPPPYTPLSTTPAQASANSTINAFVSELDFNPTLSMAYIDYATFLGGTVDAQGTGIALDGNHEAWVTGYTGSPDAGYDDFPTTSNALQVNWGGQYDGFVTHVNSTGSSWVFSDYLGGGFVDAGTGVAVLQSTNKVYLTGMTASRNFYPTSSYVNSGGHPFQPNPGWPASPPSAGQYKNAFITEINPS